MGMLRFFFALSVIASHANKILGLEFVGGLMAVESFFIISGFYMALILNEKYTGKGSYKLFISNRFLKLFPIYWIVLILAVLLSLYEGWPIIQQYIKYSHYMSPITVIYLFFTNLFMLGQDSLLFLRLNLLSGNLIFTSNFENPGALIGGIVIFWKFVANILQD